MLVEQTDSHCVNWIVSYNLQLIDRIRTIAKDSLDTYNFFTMEVGHSDVSVVYDKSSFYVVNMLLAQ